MSPPSVASRSDAYPDVAVVDGRLIEVKFGVSALRSVRLGLVQLAYAMASRPGAAAFLVLPDVAITHRRLREEWQLAAAALKPDLSRRLALCVGEGDRFIGIPRDPDAGALRAIRKAVAKLRPRTSARTARGEASFVVLKILFHHWLSGGAPVTTDWLATTSGYSYPTIAGVLRELGSLIERRTNRRVRLRWFSRDEFARLLAESDRARMTARFVDRSGQPRSPESHLRRLQKLAPPGIAIGGVLGAKHYVPDLDLVGLPRLDLSQHRPKQHLDLTFVRELDPALTRVEDPLEPATLVVHAVRHAAPLFTPRAGGLEWADPIECLLDLNEAGLKPQASQFLDTLERKRPRT